MAHAGPSQALALARSANAGASALPLPPGKLNLQQNAGGGILLLLLMKAATLTRNTGRYLQALRKTYPLTLYFKLTIFSASYSFFWSLTDT